jgi:hypothetical protein
MYPEQPQQAPVQSPSDYLNQIAPQAPKKSLFKPGPLLILVIIAGLIVIVSAVAVITNVVTNARKGPLERLGARLETTQTLAEDAQSKLRSSQLRTLNSNLQIQLTNTNRDIGDLLESQGVDLDKLSKSIAEEESGDPIANRLEDARLNAIYDRTYAREMAYQLERLVTLMKQVYASTGDSDFKAFLKTAYDNLQPTQQSFADFNAANG